MPADPARTSNVRTSGAIFTCPVPLAQLPSWRISGKDFCFSRSGGIFAIFVVGLMNDSIGFHCARVSMRLRLTLFILH